MAQTLSVKVDAQVNDFSRNLDQAGRRWEKFGRDLNQGSRALTQSFGMTSSALGGLARSFDVAGNAAGIFAGIDGIAGIASSLAVGGPVLAGLAALTIALSLAGNSAEENKLKLSDFKTMLDKFAPNVESLKKFRNTLLTDFTDTFDKVAELEKRWAGSMTDAASRAITEKATGLGALKEKLKLLTDQTADVNRRIAELAPVEAKNRVKELADEVERLARAAREMNQGAFLQAWRLHQPGFPGGINQAGAAAAIAGTPIVQGLHRGLSPGLLNQSQDEVIKQLEEQAQFLKLFELGLEKVDDTLKSGFANMAPALASVLAPMIGLLFQSREGQAGASILGSFGEGLLTAHNQGKWFTPLLGVLGGTLGAIAGGLIGDLFGGRKKQEDRQLSALDMNTRALEKMTESITNLPIGIKVAPYRYSAASPQPIPQPLPNPEGDQAGFTPRGPNPRGQGGVRGMIVNIGSIGTMIFPDVRSPEDFVRALGRQATKSLIRGGAMPLGVALAGR